ncbi:YggT family protein [Pseudonocardia sp. EV170527-09]|uniref:YggT family protein n=1 Tax=Pseudonocardia sp. EV170527-09 TaxID=2603411 RepID=UPI001F02A830|nr:YggT family protein [Pseudonocardia sp. EV170527-09]
MVAYLLSWLLGLFQLVLIARVIVDWIEVLGSGRGGAVLDTARRITHGLTEPVVAPIRRRVQPVRMGAVGLDLSVLIVFVVVLLARVLVVPLIPF